MIDIIAITDDLKLFDTQTERAKNILSVQIGSLEYIPDFGIDLKYFLSPEFSFQNASFKSYLVQILSQYTINVDSITETLDPLFVTDKFNLTPSQVGTSLIAR